MRRHPDFAEKVYESGCLVSSFYDNIADKQGNSIPFCDMKINELAALAGVSPATVSRAFSHHPYVRDDIRERIFALARKHGYHPRIPSRRRTVMILTPPEGSGPAPFCVLRIQTELARELARRSFRIEILPMDNKEILDGNPFCAAAAVGTEASQLKGWYERFAVPLVVVDRQVEKTEPGMYVVRSDERQGMRLALSHLKERGCRRIGCVIHGLPGTGNTDPRREAVELALAELGLPGGEAFVACAKDEDYLEIIGRMLRRHIDALFCPGGNGGTLAAYALGLFNRKIPEDISLVASEQSFFSRYGIPPQTTISPNYSAMAVDVADAIEAHLSGLNPPSRVERPYLLIPRESVR